LLAVIGQAGAQQSPFGPTTPKPSAWPGQHHVIFTFVDHWEPGVGREAERLSEMWHSMYGEMARKHHDSDGKMPQHSWFCRYLERRPLQIISRSVYEGLGEMDVHIHHGSSNDDGVDNTVAMGNALDYYLAFLRKVGACYSAEETPHTAFGFIHGMWALDNSRATATGTQYCGVNRELDLLLSRGCFGDFTFPAWGTMQPTVYSRIYASADGPEPKSYDYSWNQRFLGAGLGRFRQNELLIFEGPGTATNIDQNELPTIYRMNDWVAADVHLPGRENWTFVKVYTHSAQAIQSGAQGVSSMMGEAADQFFHDIERRYDDGVNSFLHYASAREAVNMALAAMDGLGGNPNDYRDYYYKRPVNRQFWCNAFYEVLTYGGATSDTVICIDDEVKTLELDSAAENGAMTIMEADAQDGPFHRCDGQISTSGEGTMRVHDSTPSKYYKLMPRLLGARNWDLYR